MGSIILETNENRNPILCSLNGNIILPASCPSRHLLLALFRQQFRRLVKLPVRSEQHDDIVRLELEVRPRVRDRLAASRDGDD